MKMSIAKGTMMILSGVCGGLGSFIWVNAVFEQRTSLGVWSSHDNSNFYLVDFMGAVACASIAYCLASVCEQGRIHRLSLDEQSLSTVTIGLKSSEHDNFMSIE
jgi:hypothetical protein